jgi:uroporphyrinogen III methyltransferase / synthase
VPVLAGCRVLVGRARPGTSGIASRLRAFGAEVVEAPEVKVEALADWTELDQMLLGLHGYGAMIFACAASVDVVFPRLRRLGFESDVPIIAIGAQAVDALRRFGAEPQVVTEGACVKELRARLCHLTGTDCMLFSSSEGRPQLRQDLGALGVRVCAVAAYRYLYQFAEHIPEKLDLIVIPSSSAASLLLETDLAPALRGVSMVAMGESSARSARLYGATRVIRAERDTVDAIVACAVEQLVKKNGLRTENEGRFVRESAAP